MKLTEQQTLKLKEALPVWAVKPHPAKTNMTAIHPMAVIDRLNEVFGIGGWSFTTEFISCEKRVQKTKNGERDVYDSAVKGRLTIEDLILEQYGGSTNDDKGDAIKGGCTDALTKIASYLGIGAEIYKNHGNVDGEMTKDEALYQLEQCVSLVELKAVFDQLGAIKADADVIAKKDELKTTLL